MYNNCAVATLLLLYLDDSLVHRNHNLFCFCFRSTETVKGMMKPWLTFQKKNILHDVLYGYSWAGINTSGRTISHLKQRECLKLA